MAGDKAISDFGGSIMQKESMINPELKDEFVEIIRADLEPVWYGEYDLNER